MLPTRRCERVLPTGRCERKLVPVQKLGLELVPVQELGRGEVFWARNLKESDNHWRKGCLLLDEEERGEPVFFKGNAPRNRPDQNGELQSAYPNGKAYPNGNCTTKCTNPTAAHPITTTEKCKRISANGKSISVFPLKSTILISNDACLYVVSNINSTLESAALSRELAHLHLGHLGER